ncbi:MAG: hypothetical protein LBE38_04305 [Deltaproteobacteria bacterium]|jgi:putative RNA 2'-phosphotransferase|nr:hypothetical protein [Deltaproteobacteria bacterium]
MSRKVDHKKNSLEKLLLYALVVAPGEFGVVPQPDGYLSLKDLLAAIKDEEGFRSVSEPRIMELVNIPEGKSIFEVEGNCIRVKPSHSPPYTPLDANTPPTKELYIGLKMAAWEAAHRVGLYPKKPKESTIGLFTSKDLALKVAKRFCPDPQLIRVQAQKAASQGLKFVPFSEELFLCEFVPDKFLIGPPIKEREKEPKKEQAGTFTPSILVAEPQVSKGKKKGKYSDAPEWKTQTRKDRREGGRK